ncbi:MAG TPA: M14 family zinc carboxypeptidase, partial [Pirellulaceae bacterium]
WSVWFAVLLTACGPVSAQTPSTGSATDAQRLEPPTAALAAYDREFFPNARYKDSIPTQGELLGFESGERSALSTEIEKCIQAWTTGNPRAQVVEYARSHEGRRLCYVVITSPENHKRLDEIRGGMDRLASPEGLSEDDAEELIGELPAVAWLAYTIHGDETEGSDAALAVMYHLLADTSPATTELLRDMVIIIDPVMNPDGRDRYVKMVTEHKGTLPDLDDQSLLHSGYWPRGRGNHYLFDLNRDWILGVHPETRGRIREAGRWHPLLFVDAHGMGSQDTHLFSPPRAPFNPNKPDSRHRWADIFVRDHAAAFDRMGWLYYHGEWNEEWYPGYSDSWAAYRGAVGILYEQASISGDGILRPEGRVLSYRESVHHHVVGSMTNLETLRQHARERLRDFWRERQAAVSKSGRFGKRTFAILPTKNQSRWRRFLDLMLLQGFTVHQTTEVMTVASARDTLGRDRQGLSLPSGTLLIPNRQPLAHLVAAMLEFDTRLDDDVLRKEREEILKNGGSRIYDTTAWSIAMLYGLGALELPEDVSEGIPILAEIPAPAWEFAADPDTTVALVIDGASDDSLTVAARLMERDVEVRVARKDFEFDGSEFPRGSIVVTQLDNRSTWPTVVDGVATVTREIGMSPVAVSTGL